MTVAVFSIYNAVVGLLTGLGLGYLLYLERRVARYQPFLIVVTVGVLIFSVAGPVTALVAPNWGHVVSGFAALVVIIGLYVPIHGLLRNRGSLTMLVRDPASVRLPPNWMSPMDDDILELFHSAELVLTPAIIAYNLDYSREEVNRHLTKLQDHDFVERVERGKYRITHLGDRYLDGRLQRGRHRQSESVTSQRPNL